PAGRAAVGAGHPGALPPTERRPGHGVPYPSPHAAPLLRQPPAGIQRRPAGGAGIARPRQPVHHPDLYPPGFPAPRQGLRQRPPPGAEKIRARSRAWNLALIPGSKPGRASAATNKQPRELAMKIIATACLLIASLVPAPLATHAEEQPRTLSTTGQGEIKVAADQAVVRMQVETVHRAAGDAKVEVDRRVNALLAALDKLGIPRKDIIASNLRLQPNFDYHQSKPAFTGYNASRDLAVTLRKLDELNEPLDAAVGSGINQISQVALEPSRADTHREAARPTAIADSKAKAALLAKAYGAELGPIHSIHYPGASPLPAAKMEMAMVRMAADSGAAGQYLHDEITFSDTISVVYELIIPR